MKQKESNCIYYMKALAIISVVCAHISVVPESFAYKSQFVNTMLNEIGAIGVGIFFAISGYLFYSSKTDCNDFCSFWIRKFKTIGVPWLLSATLVYLYVAVRKGGSFLEYVTSVLGYLSSYWYLNVTFVLFFLFYFIKKTEKKKMIMFAILLACCTPISVFLRCQKIIPSNAFGVYLNVFNWTLFFSIGFIVANKKSFFENKFLKSKSVTVALLIISMLALVSMALGDNHFTYFCMLYVPIEILLITSIYMLCSNFINVNDPQEKYFAMPSTADEPDGFRREHNKKRVFIDICRRGLQRLLIYLGKMSFCIYLYNELLWAGLIVKIGERYDMWYLFFLRPILCMACVCLEMQIAKKIFSKFGKEKLFLKLVGIRA